MGYASKKRAAQGSQGSGNAGVGLYERGRTEGHLGVVPVHWVRRQLETPAHPLAWQARPHITRLPDLCFSTAVLPGSPVSCRSLLHRVLKELCKSKGEALRHRMVLGDISSPACETGELSFGRLFSFVRHSEQFCCLNMAGR